MTTDATTHAETTTYLDPANCRPVATRAAVRPDDCDYLIRSIREHSQQVAAIVRRTGPGDTHDYEIVCGARRHVAVSFIRDTDVRDTGQNRGLLFRAEIRDLTDAEAFALADRDNRHRRDITDYQRATDYTHALARHFDGNQRAMAGAIMIQPSELSRYLTLAALPVPIIEAFGDPARVTVTHVRKLGPCLKNPVHAEIILQAAERLALDQSIRRISGRTTLAPETVVHRLVRAAIPAPPAPPMHTVLNEAGVPIATGQLRRNGILSVDIFAACSTLPPPVLAATGEILQKLTAIKTGWQNPTSSDSVILSCQAPLVRRAFA